jgi:hypothetical protein
MLLKIPLVIHASNLTALVSSRRLIEGTPCPLKFSFTSQYVLLFLTTIFSRDNARKYIVSMNEGAVLDTCLPFHSLFESKRIAELRCAEDLTCDNEDPHRLPPLAAAMIRRQLAEALKHARLSSPAGRAARGAPGAVSTRAGLQACRADGRSGPVHAALPGPGRRPPA